MQLESCDFIIITIIFSLMGFFTDNINDVFTYSNMLSFHFILSEILNSIFNVPPSFDLVSSLALNFPFLDASVTQASKFVTQFRICLPCQCVEYNA